ncbi:MAG TPA: RNA methyltransferase [Terracidiphilus sp.]|nr:RNA methyltransferase [Terracidiphilus sp.]
MKQLRRALNRTSRDDREPAAIEGPNLLAEALKAHLKLDCVFAAQEYEHLLEPLHLPDETEILLMPSALLVSALDTETPQPVAALLEPPSWTWHDLLEPPDDRPPLLLVLASIQDPGNLGTILRSAEAFGATGILTLPGTVSPWNQKALRASAGSVFRLPMLSVAADDCFRQLRKAGVTVLTTSSHASAPAHQVDLAHPTALLIGNEGNGVPEDIAAQADRAISIPCPGPVESLNAAVAAAILLYEASRQRSAKAVPVTAR